MFSFYKTTNTSKHIFLANLRQIIEESGRIKLKEEDMAWHKGKTIDLVALLTMEESKEKAQRERDEISSLSTLRIMRVQKTSRSVKKVEPLFDLETCQFYTFQEKQKDFSIHKQTVLEKASKNNLQKKQHFLIIWQQPAIEYYEQVLHAFPELIILTPKNESNIEASLSNLKTHFQKIDTEHQNHGFPALNWDKKKRYTTK